MSPPAATCYLMDVGLQPRGNSGSSNVILLPRPSGKKWPDAIVIDCGPRIGPTLELLKRQQVKRITHILITHNDDDHCGGLVPLLKEVLNEDKPLSEKIGVGYVGYLQDREADRIRFPDYLEELKDRKLIKDTVRLEIERDRKPSTIWERAPLRLEVLYPAFGDNRREQQTGDRNAASAVLRLSYRGNHAILFPGDGQIRSLERARDYFVRHKREPAATLSCDVLVVPHHGGMLGRPRPNLAELQRLYAEVVRYNYAVVSVATDNTHEHPFPEHIQALVQPRPGTGGRRVVLCTQITGQCCGGGVLPGGRKGLLPPLPDVPRASDAGTNPSGIACAGTVVVDVGDCPLQPRRVAEHQKAVNELENLGCRPLCR